MGRFGKSFTTATIVTFWLMCMTFGFGTLYTLATGGDVVAYAGQCVVLGFLMWGFFTWAFYELHGWIEERNKPRDRTDSPAEHPVNRDHSSN